MPLTGSQRNTAYAERRKARGETRVPVWIPNTPAAKAKLRRFVDELCGELDPEPPMDWAIEDAGWWKCQRDGTCRLDIGLVHAEVWRVEWWPGGPVAWLWYAAGPTIAGEAWRPEVTGRATSQRKALEQATQAVSEHRELTAHQRASLARRTAEDIPNSPDALSDSQDQSRTDPAQ